MSTSFESNANLNITIANSSTPERPVTVSIEDRVSGQTVLEFELSKADFMAALAGLYLSRIPGWIIEPKEYERVGKLMETKQITPQLPADTSYENRDALGLDRAAAAWALDYAAAHDWETWEVRLHGGGVMPSVVFRRWRALGAEGTDHA